MMMLSRVLLAAVLSIACISSVFAAHCNSVNPQYGPENNLTIQVYPEPTLLSQTKYGKAYYVNVTNWGGNTTSGFHVVHVWGTPYQMGYAQGQLMKNRAADFINRAWTYFESQVESALQFMPPWLAQMVADLGLEVALDVTEALTYDWTGSYFWEELQGISDATGVDYRTLVRVHMIAGLTEGKCSMIGAWGQATLNGNLIQLRALDWDMDGPFRDYPQLTVYHPNQGNGNTFINVGMTGFVGGLTGLSSNQLAISEIGVAYPDASFGSESRVGIPFIFLLRDILQFDVTVDDAIARIANEKRTCDLILGVGDGKLGEFRGFEYSSSAYQVFDDVNMMPYNNTWHPRIKNAVYWGMDWLCPGYNVILGSLIQKYWGKITPELAIQSISGPETSGDNHIAYCDLTEMQLYVSFAAPHDVGGNPAAYARQYTKLDAKTLFNEPQPKF